MNKQKHDYAAALEEFERFKTEQLDAAIEALKTAVKKTAEIRYY